MVCSNKAMMITSMSSAPMRTMKSAFGRVGATAAETRAGSGDAPDGAAPPGGGGVAGPLPVPPVFALELKALAAAAAAASGVGAAAPLSPGAPALELLAASEVVAAPPVPELSALDAGPPDAAVKFADA